MESFEDLRAKILPILLPYGVRQVALFGSVVRGEDTPESDVDILVEFEEPPRKPLGFFTWARLKQELRQEVDARASADELPERKVPLPGLWVGQLAFSATFQMGNFAVAKAGAEANYTVKLTWKRKETGKRRPRYGRISHRVSMRR